MALKSYAINDYNPKVFFLTESYRQVGMLKK